MNYISIFEPWNEEIGAKNTGSRSTLEGVGKGVYVLAQLESSLCTG